MTASTHRFILAASLVLAAACGAPASSADEARDGDETSGEMRTRLVTSDEARVTTDDGASAGGERETAADGASGGATPDAEATGRAPSTLLPQLGRGYPPLPERVDGLLVKARIGEAWLFDARERLHASAETFMLVHAGSPPRLVLLNGRFLDDAGARALGIDGRAAAVHVERAANAHECEVNNAHLACIRSLSRLDGTSAIPMDVGATLEALIVAHGTATATADGGALRERASAAAREVALPPGATPGRSERGLVFAPAWVAGGTAPAGLEVVILARQARDWSTEGPNPSPHAGQVWCDAPLGADCAPRCVPPRERITTRATGEAGLRAIFDASGRRLALDDLGAGVIAAAQIGRDAVGDCVGY